MSAGKYAERVVYVGDLSASCQVCHKKINNVIFDCYVPTYGMWRHICPDCFVAHRCRTGLGRGKQMILDADGQWYVVAGGE